MKIFNNNIIVYIGFLKLFILYSIWLSVLQSGHRDGSRCQGPPIRIRERGKKKSGEKFDPTSSLLIAAAPFMRASQMPDKKIQRPHI